PLRGSPTCLPSRTEIPTTSSPNGVPLMRPNLRRTSSPWMRSSPRSPKIRAGLPRMWKPPTRSRVPRTGDPGTRGIDMHNVYSAAGLVGVTLLALAACGSAEEQTPETNSPEESAPQESAEDNAAQNDSDQNGADQESAEPAEETSPQDEATDEAQQGSGDNAAQVPELAEIEDEVWDVSASQDSVNITGEMA